MAFAPPLPFFSPAFASTALSITSHSLVKRPRTSSHPLFPSRQPPRAQAGYIPDKDDRAEPPSDVPTQLTLAQQLLLKQYEEQVERMSPEDCRKLAIEVVHQMIVKDNILRQITKKDINFGIEPPDPDDFQTQKKQQ